MEHIKVGLDDLTGFVNELLKKSGVDPEEAAIIADNLIWCDLAGHYNHGIWRLPIYLKRFKLGLIQSPSNPAIERKSETICLVHGNRGFGQYLGVVAMNKAIELAKEKGTGVVPVRDSNHFGSAGYYVNIAAQNQQIGFAISNSVPKVAPFGGVSPVFGTNPFSFGVPTSSGRAILVDFSTAASAGSVIIKAVEENKNIPEGLVIDEEGKSITDPKKASQGTLLPFGGAKGFCMALMTEILSGVITGSAISHEIASMFNDFSGSQNLGHLFIAIDISRIIPLETYFERISYLIDIVKRSKTMMDVNEILIPGERRWRFIEKQKQEGIQLDKKSSDALKQLAVELKVAMPW